MLRLIRLGNRGRWHGCWCAVRQIVACESLKTATVVAPCHCNVSLLLTVSPSASQIAHSSASTTSIRPVPRYLRRVLHSFACLHTAGAPTRPSSERDPSIHHIQTPAPTFASFSLAQRCTALLAVLLSSSIIVFTTGSSPGATYARFRTCTLIYMGLLR